jgi:hypothetical protein
MFWLLIALFCLGLINWQLMVLALVVTVFFAYPVLLFLPTGVILGYFILRKE